MSNGGLFIVDNESDEQSVKHYLINWCEYSKQMDIATGYFEIGGLLELDDSWQKLDKIRIILGNEVTPRTKDIIDQAVTKMKESIDDEQEQNEFLTGVPAILDAMKSGKIECRVYDQKKFHAKTYITYFRDECREKIPDVMNIPDGYALVGSSNFTKAGLTNNIELNVQINNDVEQLQEWFNAKWEDSQDITEAVLKVIESHVKDFSPYDVYMRSMYEYFKSREETISEWENHNSVIYPLLAQYQKDGYNSLIEIAERYSGAFLCDGVGLGKTYIGMMLIERFVKKERKNVVLIVPASARTLVWETTIKNTIPEILEGFYPFKIINHTDLTLEKNQDLMNQIAEQAEVVIIDEAHNFRNRASGRYRKLFEMMGQGPQKQLFMLTATPINNSFLDLQHLIELFTQRKDDYFAAAPLGIHSLSYYIKQMESRIKEETGTSPDAIITDVPDNVFRSDKLVNELVVQRSRAYVKRSLTAGEDNKILFPNRQAPIVANYSLRESYGRLIDDFINSFDRRDKNGRKIPILTLAIYYPYGDDYFVGDKDKIDEMTSGRQAQVVSLIRQLLLKRFESSIAAFEETCIKIYTRLKKFVVDYKEYGNVRSIDRLFANQSDVMDYVEEFWPKASQKSEEDIEDELPDYVWDVMEEFDISDFDIGALIDDTLWDMDVLAGFIRDMMEISPECDDKMHVLINILREDSHTQNKKVIVFSEYRATAVYIFNELKKAGFKHIFEIDGQTSKSDRYETIQRFAPYYNGACSDEIEDEIQILVATDVLAEGLNLQDASCIINYELHWNPVRLMQRIGRIDRRRDADIEAHLLEDHPELSDDRNNVYYWNFLPPKELDNLLKLFETVSSKTLRISKVFGIEGKKLLTEEDDYEALKEFNSQYEGETSAEEVMELAYQELLADNPDYVDLVDDLPRKMYSGKMASTKKGFFFCYELPNKRADGSWTDGDGLYRWYLLDTENDNITDQTYEIWKAIQCDEEEPRELAVTEEQFLAMKKRVEDYITKNYMRAVQAPVGAKFRLVTWMQLC